MINATGHTMNATPSAIERLQLELPALDWITDTNRVARLSRDFSWFSPVLKRQLEGHRADIVVKPINEEQIVAIVAACVRLSVPITIRGSGTGNYGQTTPLDGGVVMDMTSFNAFCWVRPGVARAQAGMRLLALEKHANASGQELRCMPSTYRSATLGGLFGGGFGGIGSINYGPLAAPGNVLGIRAMTIEAEPKIVELRGPDALRMHHMWGTNGLVLEIEVGLAPMHPWLESLATFESFDEALTFADKLANAPGIAKKEVAFLASPVPDHLEPLRAFLSAGSHVVLSLIAEHSEETFLTLLQQHGGSLAYRKTADEAIAAHRTLMEFTWNHATLNALKVDPTLTYLQTSFIPGRHVEQVREMERELSGEVLTHVEFLRNIEGLVTCSGLQLVRFTTEERLNEIMAIYRAKQVRINNPHVYIVEDGKAGGPLSAEVMATKTRFDPHALLNPGKLRDYPVRREA
jgi:FAD/FMN-containing dehydrogenase